MKLTFYGTRGSIPVSDKKFDIYGGETSCLRVCSSEEPMTEIYIDAGSGITKASPFQRGDIHVLIGHLHLDHVIGLPFFKGLSEKERKINIYLPDKEKSEAALKQLISPPYWPIGLLDYPAEVNIRSLEGKFDIASIHIQMIKIKHPGGSTAFRLSENGHSFVYATDFEHDDNEIDKLTSFCKDADLLIYDGQYTKEEYSKHMGYGHSFPEIGLEIAKRADVKKILFTHFDPTHDDSFLTEWEKQIQKENPSAGFAKKGMSVSL
ncbi:MBL fold metallo-hydrolase [Butyrivibrio sp. YAB3001]|uniref:MBL fold metallo-hydrolase n=1 Tax=Butyrivibrio sp. YAB3001 TaxID=1520812 RepID=UPI0008F64044|nr:MBL fold metallo-hydrolase [Butyrivibrio sp. YAB3001]SFB69300.1 Ribonuclease BN, tRNA processing enzyme [Butyrivibrio sp. YAB3001]